MTMVGPAGFLAAVLAAPAGEFARPITVGEAGRTAVLLDDHVYAHARADLADLRIADASGAYVPFLMLRGLDREQAPLRPTIRSQGAAGRSSTAVLDFGERASKSDLTLLLSGDSFRRRVVVDGSPDGRVWRTLQEGAYVFAFPAPRSGRYETVALPENDDRFLRVTVLAGPAEAEAIEIRDAWVDRMQPRLREIESRARPSVVEDSTGRETVLAFDLGAARRPFTRVDVDVATQQFFRGARVETRDEGGDWHHVGDGGLYRYREREGVRECLRLGAAGRGRHVRVRISNGDDRPLEVRSARVFLPEERVVFEAGSSARYVLIYGNLERGPARFDLQKTVADASAWAAAATPASLGPPVPRVTARRWTESHPTLAWSAFVAIVVALAIVTLRALRAAR